MAARTSRLVAMVRRSTLSTIEVEAGPYVFIPFEVPLFYTNPLAGDYQDFVGNNYHAMEIFDFRRA